ncbi:CrcB family protein [Nocardioides psychrotolerans]|uniref:fluoride efflux transporter FluC n=1 Tax=Nocardioides psychrotolerans TaxID=1005945 RepID=UPI003137F7CE
MTALLVAVGGAVGAALRFLLGHLLDRDLPVGTFAVNVVGSFLLGLFTALSLDEQLLALLGTGFCGGLTTYSAFAVQTHARGRRGALYAALTVVVALGACALGFWVGQA